MVIAPKVPDPSENKRDRRLANIIRALSGMYEVHFVYIQSLFTKESAVKAIEDMGVKVLSLQGFKKERKTSNFMKDFFGDNAYGAVLFNTYFTAKYYLPYLQKYSPGSVIVIDVGKSQYVSEVKLARDAKEAYKKASILKNADIDKMKEIPIYNNVDVVLVDSAEDQAALSRDIPNVAVCVIPGTKDNKGAADGGVDEQEVVRVFPTFQKVKKNSGQGDVRTIVIKRGSGNREGGAADEQYGRKVDDVTTAADAAVVDMDGAAGTVVGAYNKALGQVAGDYGLIVTDAAVVPRESLRRMVVCAQSHPQNGLITPLSNIDSSGSITLDTLSEYLERHYVSEFGNWQEIRCAKGECFLVKRHMIESVGLLDERFLTLEYALFDYCLRAVQQGFKCIGSNEAFVFYHVVVPEDKKSLGADKKLLYEKWGKDSAEFIEMLK
jgi:hypothetical protein